MNRIACTSLLLAFLAPVFAETLIETNSDFDGLPDVIEFDCFPSADNTQAYFEPLNRRMLIPRNFEQSPDDPGWINWNVRIVGENESIVFPYVGIQFGDLDGELHWIEKEFELLSPAVENGFGVDIYQKQYTGTDLPAEHWLFLLAEDKFLKVVSPTEIDWASLLTCFE